MGLSLFNKQKVWDILCALSVVGIWPRFIEPYRLHTTKLALRLQGLPHDLQGLRILQFSDLHLQPRTPDSFLNKVLSEVQQFSPDLILFTGDFLCRSRMEESSRLKDFLCGMRATHGCYAILGNHDYNEYVSITPEGDYDIVDRHINDMRKGIQRVFAPLIRLTRHVTDRAQKVALHTSLIDLLGETPFTLLHNESQLIPIKGSALNLCGFGDYMLGKMQPTVAYQNYDKRYPGILLTHNPDSVKKLKGYPGDLIFAGHTHGGQVDIPVLRNRFFVMEDICLKKGLCSVDNRWLYVNRGLGSVTPLRWRAAPELLLMTLRG